MRAVTPRAVRVLISLAVAVALLASSTITSAQSASASGAGVTVAGGNGTGAGASQFHDPFGIARDSAGNIYVADSLNHRVQRWAPGATTGVTVAGGNGKGAGASQLDTPYGVALDSAGNIYVADTGNHRVQRWAPNAPSGLMVAGGFGSDPAGPVQQLNAPVDVAVDTAGNVYVLENSNHRVQRWTQGATSGMTIAGGNGAGAAANQLNEPNGLALDSFNNVYVADTLNHRVQRWSPGATTGVTVAGGNGEGAAANQFSTPWGVAVDGTGNIYVADVDNQRIQRWAPGATVGEIVAGGNSPGDGTHTFQFPVSVALDSAGNMYVTDWGNDRVQRWAPWQPSGLGDGVTVAGGNGPGTAANQFDRAQSAVDASGNVYIADSFNHRVQRWAPGATTGATVAGGNGPGAAADQLDTPWAVAVDGVGNVYVADTVNHRVQRWAPGATAGVTVAGGNGDGSAANQLSFPNGLTVDDAGNVYVADSANDRIQRWALGATSGVTVAGGNGPGAAANQLSFPIGIAVSAGNVHVGDTLNHRVQRWAPGAMAGVTVAGGNGQGSAATQLNGPQGVEVDGDGNVYVADYFNDRVQRWAPGATTGVTVAGGNGRGDAAHRLNRPGKVALDGAGNLYVSDTFNHRVQVWGLGAPGPDPVDLVPVAPARVLETRVGPGLVTVDGLLQGGGRRASGSTLELTVAGRGGVPADAAAVMLNVTGITPDISGFLTVYPCGSPRPLASNLNPTVGEIAANAVLAKIGTSGRVCIYTSVAIDLVIDVNGYVRAGASPVTVVPARLLETRIGAGFITTDGLFQGGGRRPAGSTLELTVTGRGGVPADAAAVMLNVTGITPDLSGFVTVYPCGGAQPLASNLNPAAGLVTPNAVLAKVGTAGKVCVYTSVAMDMVIDVNGHVPAGASPTSLVPARVLETRIGAPYTTVDGQFQGIGRRSAGSTLQLTVVGRGGVPANASAAMLNVTGVFPDTSGFLTIYPCGSPRPNASNLNPGTGDVVANAVLAKVGTAGKVCIYTSATIDLVIDINGHIS